MNENSKNNCGCNSTSTPHNLANNTLPDNAVTTFNGEIDQLEVNGTLLVASGKTAIYDATRGILKINGKLENHGTLIIRGSTDEAQIETNGIINEGRIISEVGSLRFLNSSDSPFILELEGGSISATNKIEFYSNSEISLKGGNLKSERASFVSKKFLLVFANRIDAKISLAGTKSALAVNHGDLIVEKNDVTDDPMYYNFSGNISAPGFTHSGSLVQDFVAAATGNVTITSAIETNGNVLLMAGANFNLGGTLPTSGSGQLTDADCIVNAGTTCSFATHFMSFGSNADLSTKDIDVDGYIHIYSSGKIEVTGDLNSPESIALLSIDDQFIDGDIESTNAHVSLNTIDGNGSIEVNGDISGPNVALLGGSQSTPSSSTTVKVSGTIRAWWVIEI